MDVKIFDEKGRLREEAYLTTAVALKTVDENGHPICIYWNPNSRNPVAAAKNNLPFYIHAVRKHKARLGDPLLEPAKELASFIDLFMAHRNSEYSCMEVMELYANYTDLYKNLTSIEFSKEAPRLSLAPIIPFHPRCFRSKLPCVKNVPASTTDLLPTAADGSISRLSDQNEFALMWGSLQFPDPERI